MQTYPLQDVKDIKVSISCISRNVRKNDLIYALWEDRVGEPLQLGLEDIKS